MTTTYDSEDSGLPPIGLLAFERWLAELTKGMTPEEKSQHSIIIEAFLGCQDCACARVRVGPNAEGYIPPKELDHESLRLLFKRIEKVAKWNERTGGTQGMSLSSSDVELLHTHLVSFLPNARNEPRHE